MWALAGLGNPGRKYAKTRHNAGFSALDVLAGKHGVSFSEKSGRLQGSGVIGGEKALLVKPMTYMNLSGMPLRAAIRNTNVTPENLIVIHDDMDIEPGRIKIKLGGSAGGHKGIASIIDSLGGPDFIRIKIGIGRDPTMLGEDYVLKKFSKDEKALVEEAFERAAEAAEAIITEGLQKAMNEFNTQAEEENGEAS